MSLKCHYSKACGLSCVEHAGSAMLNVKYISSQMCVHVRSSGSTTRLVKWRTPGYSQPFKDAGLISAMLTSGCLIDPRLTPTGTDR